MLQIDIDAAGIVQVVNMLFIVKRESFESLIINIAEVSLQYLGV